MNEHKNLNEILQERRFIKCHDPQLVAFDQEGNPVTSFDDSIFYWNGSYYYFTGRFSYPGKKLDDLLIPIFFLRECMIFGTHVDAEFSIFRHRMTSSGAEKITEIANYKSNILTVSEIQRKDKSIILLLPN